MPENENAPRQSQPHGVFIRGTFKGTQPARSFVRASDGETVNVKPRIGLDVDGEELVIKCPDDAAMRAAIGSAQKGQEMLIRVDVRPPFGARGAVDFLLPGTIAERAGQSWT